MLKNDLKLLAVFLYSAYDSKQCGSTPGIPLRENTSKLIDFIKNDGEFPQEVLQYHPKLKVNSQTQGIRNYIYLGHYSPVFENHMNQSIGNPVFNKETYLSALLCIPNFYKVNSVDGTLLSVINETTGVKMKLKLLEGLEVPREGQLVSGHWGHFLEILDPKDEVVQNYLKVNREQIKRFKELVSR